ncbi:MAG TPA: fibronectin type III domain-containing protein, partial [Tepidisphaeraceae bacterium]|nr:fibronectin type III domain-containing protein [Tepidisphaeraceae bacterium]
MTESLEARRLFASAMLIGENFGSSASIGQFTAVDGKWEVAEGVLRTTEFSKTTTSHLNNRAVHNTPVNGDFSLTVDATVPRRASKTMNDVAVVFGYQDRNNYYFLSASDANDGTQSGLFRVVNGRSTELADVTSRIAVGTNYLMRVERSGNQISAYRNGVRIASAVDSTFMSGAVGVGTKSNAGTFDNLLVTVPVQTPEPPPVKAPVAPSDLSAISLGSSDIDLAWADRSDNESGFTIERLVGGAWSEFASVGANATGYELGNLPPATTYTFRVSAFNAAGRSAYSNVASANTDAVAVAPAAPSNLTAAAFDSATIDLAWTDNSYDEDGFKIESMIGGAWTELASLGADETFYEILNLTPATTYQFRVRAFNDAGHSGYTAVASAATHDVPPVAPSTLTAAPSGSNRVALAWFDESSNEAGFTVERRADGGDTWSEVASLGAGATAYTAVNLAPATAYHFRIRAYNAAGRSAYSNTASAATDDVAPLAPSSLTALAVGTDRVELEWSDESANEIGFTIERSLDGETWSEVGTADANALSYTATGLTPGTGYHFRIRAYNAFGDSSHSATASATTADIAPALPSELTATAAGSDGIELTWSDDSHNESGFTIERSTDGGATWTEIATVAANATAYTATGLAPATAYDFRIRAHNAFGTSSYSNTASATTADVAPAVPSELSAGTAGSDGIELTWSDDSHNESGFNIERSTDGGATWTEIAAVAANATAYTATGLAPATAYDFRIRAYNAFGRSTYSGTASATTADVAPAAPSALVATAAGTDRINLNWSDNSGNEAGFTIERSSDNGTTWRQIASVVADVTAHTAVSLTSRTTYQFRVRAHNAAGDSPYSNAAQATTGGLQATIDEDFGAGAGNFTVVDGPWSVVAGQLRVTADNNAATTHLNSRAVHKAPIVGDFALTVDARPLAAGAPWANAAVIFGYQNASNYYFFSSNQSNDAGTNGIFRVVNGQRTELADIAATITPGTTYQLRVEREGNVIRAYRDGSLVATATDGTFTSGQVGIGSRQFQASFDNFVVVGTRLAAPAAPSDLTAAASSSSSINLSWQDNSTNEAGFKVERSSNGGSTWTQAATVGPNVKAYAASGLTASTTYQFRVRGYNLAGDSGYSNAATVTTEAAPVASTLISPPQAAVNAAIAAPLIRFNRNLPGGAHTDGAFHGGASVTLALASYAGNTTADARLLQQMRFTLTGGNDISANGGYAAQHERHVTGMFALAKLTPRVWDQLSPAEQNKVNLLMKAAFVASAFTTSDNNPYIKSGQQQRALDADTNLNRDWNPNYREGMVGGVLVGAAYFGPAEAQRILSTYDHQAFVSELSAAGLSNIHQTFNWKQANPASIAPDAATLQQGVQNYSYYGNSLNNLMGIYGRLVTNTYGKAVTAGLNGGAGINGGGKLVSGADTQPNKGAVGMLTEFDSVDGSGPRSAANYSYDGYRPHQTNLLVLIASGQWDADSSVATEAKSRLQVGNTDLWYKMDHGYVGYYHGAPRETFLTATHATSWGFTYNRSVWEDVLQPYLNRSAPVTPTNPTTPTPAAPAAPSTLVATAVGSSVVNLLWIDNSTSETGFKVERSSNGGSTWTQVATLGANVTTYTSLDLAATTTYLFRVRAYNATGDSAYTNVAMATTAAVVIVPPTTPTNPTTPTLPPAISEDFTTSAGDFAVIDGPWSAAGGQFRLTGDNNASTTHLNSRAVHQTAMAGDFVLTVDAQPFTAGAPWANAAVIFGYQDSNNYYFFSSNQSNDGATNGIFRVVNGASTELADIAATITPGTAYQLRVERTGSEIRAYRGGELIASATDGTFASGQVGIGSRQFQAGFDNFVVTGTAVPPPSEPPAAPSNLIATPSSTSNVNLAWRDNDTTEAGFRIERSSDGGATWTQVATAGVNAKSYAAGGLAAATAYQFRVRAYNIAGNSTFSNVASATTQSAPAPGAGWDVKPDASNTGPSNPAALVGLPVRAPTAAG